MPRLKQPTSLRTFAIDILVEQCVHCLDTLSFGGDLTRFRQGVVDIKHHMIDHVSVRIFEEFCRKFLQKFYYIGKTQRRILRPDSHHRIALEMILDIKFVGLIFDDYNIVANFDPDEAPRLHGLKTLNWCNVMSNRFLPNALGNFNLHNLTTFIYPVACTDDHLRIISRRCLKLQVLKVSESHVTDTSVCALRLLTDLRAINIQYSSVSDDGMNMLLDTHKKLEHFNVIIDITYEEHQKNFNILSRPISAVCPSIKRFSLTFNLVTYAHLTYIVALFPNLTCFESYYRITGDLCILKDLKHLTELKFGIYSEFRLENLKQLLRMVGENISVLIMAAPSIDLTQYDLNFILKFCGNIEHLDFGHQRRQLGETLVIPRFKKLRIFGCYIHIAGRDDAGSCIRLEFGEMLALESLYVENVDQTLHMIESMMLDNVRFPKLREVGGFNFPHDYTNRIHEIAKSNNLDISVKSRRL